MLNFRYGWYVAAVKHFVGTKLTIAQLLASAPAINLHILIHPRRGVQFFLE
jgi:hypothetical protein